MKFRVRYRSLAAAFTGLQMALCTAVLFGGDPLLAFEGHIHARQHQGPETNELVFTVSPAHIRIANSSTNWPHPANIVDRQSNTVTILYPHNRSFVRLDAARLAPPPAGPGGMPALPPGVGPQLGGTASGMPAMPVVPAMPMEPLELKATGQKTNLVGFACQRYEAKHRGEVLEVWATDKLFPYQPYRQNQPPRFGPRRIEEQWPEMLRERKLFPLLVSLRYDHGPERLRFEVRSVKPESITDADGALFRPPKDYHETEPLPF